MVDIENARLEEQRKVMLEIIESGDDPFSEENLAKYHKNPILKRGTYWFVTENQWPYQNIKKQFLFITLKYADDLSGISAYAFKELFVLANEICNEYNIKGGALCMRFGDTRISGATVKHLHYQLIESDPEQGPVTFYIGGKKKTEQ